MSSCLTGGTRPYSIDLEILKSPSSTSTWTSSPSSSSLSSTLSESSNSPLAISTRKPRTPRKRLHQTYNEAATLLSTACPNIFPKTKHLRKPCKFTKPNNYAFFHEPSELLLPFPVIDGSSGFLLHQPILEKPRFRIEPRVVNREESCSQSPVESDFQVDSLGLCDGYGQDFDAESILDEEIEEGIDSIMGNLSVNNDDTVDEYSNVTSYRTGQTDRTWFGHPMGLGFGGEFDFLVWMRRRGVRASRHVDDEGDWWRNPRVVNVVEISPNFSEVTTDKKNKKKKKSIEKSLEKCSESPRGNSFPKLNPGLLLKLNYEEVLNAWSDRGTPFSGEIPGRNDPHLCFSSTDGKLNSKKRNSSLLL